MVLWSVLCVKQKTAYEMRISVWSSDVCSSDLRAQLGHGDRPVGQQPPQERLELVVGPVDLVDEKDRRRTAGRGVERLEQRPADQEPFVVELVLERLEDRKAFVAGTDVSLRLKSRGERRLTKQTNEVPTL